MTISVALADDQALVRTGLRVRAELPVEVVPADLPVEATP